MEMESELEPRVKPLAFKVKAMSRESPSQKATNVLDSDLRTHWSTGTNTKEWIVLELDEPCLLSHIRIYNKSVLEWEISVGLRYKPENFTKVRPRCEAPRRDMLYPTNYTACRYIRISCLRGNPIAIFFIQLIGVPVIGLEPEFQPVVSYLLPHIISHKEDAVDLHLQLLQDISKKLLVFLPQLENDLNSFPDAAETKIRFFAMIVGPFYPILHLVNERASTSGVDTDPSRNKSSSTLTISSNFEVQPRRSRCPYPISQPACNLIAFRPEAAFLLLRKAYENSDLGIVCRVASRALQVILQPITSIEDTMKSGDMSMACKDDCFKNEEIHSFILTDYSSLFGEDFQIYHNHLDDSCTSLLDMSLVEEAILHVLYASASEPTLCHVMAENVQEFWSLLPLIQALLPALRPPSTGAMEQVDETFLQWKTPLVQRALAQIASVSSSLMSRSLLHASAGYLLSFQQSQARAACLLIDLHFGPLAPWTSLLITKIDLAIELLEDLLDAVQLAAQSASHVRAALKYVILGLSGHMDDVLARYKEVKYRVLFLVEMLEPFLDPAISASKPALVFGDPLATVSEKQERACAAALDVIRTAVGKAAVLSSLESEWRLGSVAPSVLLSILGPHMALPDEIDFCKCNVKEGDNGEFLSSHPVSLAHNLGHVNESDARLDLEALIKTEGPENANFLFASAELKNIDLTNRSSPQRISINKKSPEPTNNNLWEKQVNNKFSDEQLQNSLYLMPFSPTERLKFHSDYLQLMNLDDAERRSAEFVRLALNLHMQVDATPEGHSAAVDALLLAAECFLNPFFMISFRRNTELLDQLASFESHIQSQKNDSVKKILTNYKTSIDNLDSLLQFETKRDRIILELLLKAAKWENEYQKCTSDSYSNDTENFTHVVDISAEDMESADAVTLLRQNQALLCNFLTKRLLSGQKSLHEVLLQVLSFYLRSATELFCPPEDIVEIIIKYAVQLNSVITSFYRESTNNHSNLDREKLYSIQRCWSLLQNLVVASSSSDIGLNNKNIVNVCYYGSLVPLVSWIQKISAFSHSPFPVARHFGWMAISNFAKKYVNGQLFLTLDLSSLTNLLSIFLDELALSDDVMNHTVGALGIEKSQKENSGRHELSDNLHGQGSVKILYPDLHWFFPDLTLQFRTSAELILEAVGLQLKAFPSVAVPDILGWFSGFCSAPFSREGRFWGCVADFGPSLRGSAGRNAKAIILHLLESIVVAHMEAIIPEMPHLTQILTSLCKASYCDVDFFDASLCVLNPLISYCFSKTFHGESSLVNHASCDDFENMCFQEVFDHVEEIVGHKKFSSQKIYQGPLMVFLLGSLFSYLSLRRKKDILQYVISCADFRLSAPPSYADYLKAFQNFIDSCNILLIESLEPYKVYVPDELQSKKFPQGSNDFREFPSVVSSGSIRPISSKLPLSMKDVEEISQFLEDFFLKLHPSVESFWRLHSQLAHKITIASGKCYLLMRCVTSLNTAVDKIGENNMDGVVVSHHWKTAVEGLIIKILSLQKYHCWQSGCALLDFLLGLPEVFPLNHIIGNICSAIKGFCCHAPRISWRLQSDKWLSTIFGRVMPLSDGDSLLDLFCTMLSHNEPEQRAVALRHLGAIVGLDINNGVLKLSNVNYQNIVASGLHLSISEAAVLNLVPGTWDKVATLASSDPLVLLRASAMALLSGFIPFAQRSHLQAFLASSDSILPYAELHVSPTLEPLKLLSLCLLARACIYSPKEDVHLIPENVWIYLESICKSTSGSGNLEKKFCETLCNLRNADVDAKEALDGAFSPNSAVRQSDPEFESTRESVLEVLATITSMQSYMDFFSKKIDREAQELEEAEVEMELLLKENASLENSEPPVKEPSLLKSQEPSRHNDRLIKLRKEICDMEKSQLRLEVAARRQKRLLALHARQKYLEDAASHEMELLQEFDRERTKEREREIERQRLMETERAKTREIRCNLELERERQTQRELQKELEQAESGVQVSRREFSNTSGGRTRERYRDRDGGRAGGNEGSIRPSSRGHENVQASTSGPQLPTLVLSGSNRSFSGSLPTILQVRDRLDDRGTSYEESFDGSRDSGDTGSVGDPESVSGFDGLPGVFGPGGRHGSRGGKSRQIVERREREGRREGKWERKHG